MQRRRGQAGATLVEILMMLVVTVPLVLTASLGMFTAVGSSATTTTRQHLEATLSSYSESLRVMPAAEPCASAAELEAHWSSWSDRWQPESVGDAGAPDLRILEVTHWDGSTASFSADCVAPEDPEGSSAHDAQRIVVEVRLGDQALTGTVVKRALS